jgi:hypothetical protein
MGAAQDSDAQKGLNNNHSGSPAEVPSDSGCARGQTSHGCVRENNVLFQLMYSQKNQILNPIASTRLVRLPSARLVAAEKKRTSD